MKMFLGLAMIFLTAISSQARRIPPSISSSRPVGGSGQCPEINNARFSNSIAGFTGISSIDCQEGNNVGDVCQIKCSRPDIILYSLREEIECQPGGIWQSIPSRTHCVCPNKHRLGRFFSPFFSRLEDVCVTEQCHGFEDASCSVDVCDRNFAIFTNSTTNETIPKFACSEDVDWPACLSVNQCQENQHQCSTGCPLIPSALCHQDCNCNTVFVDRYTGRSFTTTECQPDIINECPSLEERDEIFICNNGRNIGSECTVNCPLGTRLFGVNTTTCSHVGQWVPSLGRTFCVPDERCPEIVSDQDALCTECPDTCPNDQICCPTSCGSECVPITVQQCPSPFNPKSRFPMGTFQLSCSNEYNIGSQCELTCIPGRILSGVSHIECLPNGLWSEDLGTTQCYYSPPAIYYSLRLPRNDNCPRISCENVYCPASPEATCFENSFLSCGYELIQDGIRIPKRDCIQASSCQVVPSFGSCVDFCLLARCPNHPGAICKLDCNCIARFYEPATFQEVNCRADV